MQITFRFPQRVSDFRKILMVAMCFFAVQEASAQISPALLKIRETGIITIGYRETSIPFSYLDSNQRPVGYTMDICKRVAEAIKAQLKLPELEYKMVSVTSATRLALVANGTVDLECGSTTNTAERQKTASFLVSTFVASTRFLSRKDSPVSAVKDLRGKNVVSSAGTTSMSMLSAISKKNDLNMQVMAANDHAESFALVENRRADAFLMDDVLLYGLIAGAKKDPSTFVISDESLSVEPYGIMVRKDDPEFKRIADKAVVALFESGEIFGIYKRWFESPIPPNGANLNMPMTPILKRVISKPTSSADPQVYR